MSDRGNVWSGNFLVGDLSVVELSIEDLSSGKYPSGKYPVGKISGQDIPRRISLTPRRFKPPLQPFTEIIETNAKNGLVPISHKQCNALFREHIVRLKIISLYIYIYKDLRLKTKDLRSSESRDHYLEDGNLVPSHRCSFSFEAAFQL